MGIATPTTDAGAGQVVPLIRQNHAVCMLRSAELTRYAVPEFISPRRVIRILRKPRLPFVLVGQFGCDGWLREARQCQRVELIVRPCYRGAALRTLQAALPTCRLEHGESDVRFFHKKSDRDLISIQIAATPVHFEVFRRALRIALSPSLMYRIPTLEMALALRYAAMIELPWSDADKYFHAALFLRMVHVNPTIDWKTLRSIGDRIGPGEGRALVKKIRDVRDGKRFEL